MGKGKFVAFVVLVCSIAFFLCVMSVIIYLRWENTDFKRFAEAEGDIRGSVSSVQEQANKTMTAQAEFATKTVELLADLSRRLDELSEKVGHKQSANQNVHLTLTEPLQIELVYRKKETVQPYVPPQIHGQQPPAPSRTPMSDKAGLSHQGTRVTQ